jgi:hypothetical protein
MLSMKDADPTSPNTSAIPDGTSLRMNLNLRIKLARQV